MIITRLREWFAAHYQTLTTRRLALYGSAVLRIGYGLAFLAFLLREEPHREQLWGPNAAWSPAMARQYADHARWYGWVKSWTTLLATTDDTRFQLSYAFGLVVCVALVAGFHTRLASCAFMLVVTAFSARDPFLGDGGDNVMVLMSVYLVFVDSGRRWSVDSRRPVGRFARRLSDRPSVSELGGELAEVRRRVVTLLHNAAVFVIGFQMCVIYGAAAMWKVQGTLWQNGSAMYYVLHVKWFQVWPGLSDFVAHDTTAMCVLAYVTVFAQIGFPFAIHTKRLKYVLLAVLLAMHLGIAVLLGLPVFSAVMVVGDSVFLPDRFWIAAARLTRRAFGRLALLPGIRTEPVYQD